MQPQEITFAERFRDYWGVETTGINGYHLYERVRDWFGQGKTIGITEKILERYSGDAPGAFSVPNPGKVTFPAVQAK